METKICSACKEAKPLSEFHKHALSKDGHFSRCKTCRKTFYEKRLSNTGDNPLAAFTPRELIIELRRRGYEGELQIVQKIKV